MSNDSKSQESRIAEEFVETTRNRLERSYKNNVIVTIVVLSLDTAGVTITGFGDTGVGFSAAHLVSAPLPVNGSGEAVLGVTFHGLDALVGLDLAIQGFVLEGGEVGFGDGLTFVVGG